MSEPARWPPAALRAHGAGTRLESWKGIAAYLGRSVRTVQRWEARSGLPVHRLQGRLASVYAHEFELDAWWDGHRTHLEHEERPSAGPGRRRRAGVAAALGAVAVAALSLLHPLLARTTRPSAVAAPPRPVDPEVREAYLKGRLFLESPTEEQTRKAIQSFEQAIHKDPGDASAYAGLARAYGAASNLLVRPRQAIPPAKAAALKALALDSSLAEAYTSRGLLRAAFDWDLPGSESDLRHALEIDPGDAPARLYLGIVLLVRGRQEEGLSEVERAQRQDPLSTKINSRLGMIYALLGQHEKSLRQCRKALELDRNSAEGHTCLGYAFERKGRYRDAIEEYERANDLGYRASPHIARVAALAGHKAEATRRLRRLKQEWQQGQAWSPYEIARVCRALGDDDQTFAWLETAYEERDQTLVGLLADPDWDGLRSDRRFVALAQRIGLRR